MTSSAEPALLQLNKWKSGSTKLFCQSFDGNVTAWCVGILKFVSKSELHFGVSDVDERDLSFVVTLRDVTFRIADWDAEPLWAPGRDKTHFGVTLELLLPDRGKVVFAEVFSSAITA
jgi:hypothetical protein